MSTVRRPTAECIAPRLQGGGRLALGDRGSAHNVPVHPGRGPVAVAPAGQQGLLGRHAMRHAQVASSKAACQASHSSALPAAHSAERRACLGPLSPQAHACSSLCNAAVCRDVQLLGEAVLRLVSSLARSVQHISCVHARAKRAAGGLTTEACRSRCIAARVRCGQVSGHLRHAAGLAHSAAG
jgi:hypothetical protein